MTDHNAHASRNNSVLVDDDKYAKFHRSSKASSGKDLCVAGCSPLFGSSVVGRFFGRVSLRDWSKFLSSANQLYVVYLIAGFSYYTSWGAHLTSASPDYLLGYVSCIVESLGLLVLRHKIARRQEVKGVSGMTMLLYSVVYTLRILVMAPTDTWYAKPDENLTALIQIPSVILAFEASWSILRKHRETYQENLDSLKAWYLLPGCAMLAVPLHPIYPEGHVHSIIWAIYMYLDAIALLPQIVMMARAEDGIVEAPLAHFVAATAFSRSVDLFFWYYDADLGPQGYMFGFNFSGYLIVTVQIITLLLMADFMYYYVRARLSGSGLSEDLTLLVDVDEIC